MIVTFWLVVSGLMLAILGPLLWPLLRRPVAMDAGEQEKRLSVYRQQFVELEQDHRNGVLTDEQYQIARRELDRRVLEETGRAEIPASASGPQLSSKAVAVVLALVIPTVSVVLYAKLGSPQAIIHSGLTASGASGQESGERAPFTLSEMEALTERLKNKLEQNPTDGVGWSLLARAYVELGRHQEAVPIYETAMRLIPNDAQMLADYADALGVLNGRKLDGRPEALIQQALKADPKNIKALMLAGTVAYNHKEFGRAASYWEEARTNLPPGTDPDAIQEIVAGIAEARELAGGRQAAQVSTPPAPANPANQAGPAVTISGQVTIAPGLAEKGSPTDTLFVFAREVNGPPMPVSIVRATRKDLPFTFRLDDSTSPMPSRKLSDVGPVVIVARLSKSGEAMPKSGDLQGMSEPLQSGTHTVAIVIDREIP
ncbi:c-type cytochrome biogenesis protein CcmI [Nitrospira lenta]|uniref:Cytochrome c-type biogenesis protein CcmI n=1 Tax=Nitrospira lenta TaxID=1436998 RepID=A0A330KZI0_9BACT|nr:c-type cytochrome biogenesis protein CcmI [Nitrospira lenta]SPP62931.1 Cytochrome c-type biogenesis protein CcmI [Nitrospira lenta]